MTELFELFARSVPPERREQLMESVQKLTPEQKRQLVKNLELAAATNERPTEEDTVISWLWRAPKRTEEQRQSGAATAWAPSEVSRDSGAEHALGSQSQLANVRQGIAGFSPASLALRSIRIGMQGSGYGGTTADQLSERAIRYVDFAGGIGMAKSGRLSQGGMAMSSAAGLLLGGTTGDKLVAAGAASSQMIGMRQGGLLKKASAGTAAAWAASVLLQDHNASKALQAPAMGAIFASFAVNDARKASAAYKGVAGARVTAPGVLAMRRHRAVAASLRHSRAMASHAGSRLASVRGAQAVGAKAAQFGGKLAASTVLSGVGRAVGSLGPVGIALRGYALGKAGHHAFNGRWKESAISLADALLFGDGSARIIHAGVKGVHHCATNARKCAAGAAAFARRVGDKAVAAKDTIGKCMRTEHRRRCYEATKTHVKKTVDAIGKATRDAYAATTNWFQEQYTAGKKKASKLLSTK